MDGLPTWVGVELALLPVVAAMIIYIARQAIRLASIEDWKVSHMQYCEQLEIRLQIADAAVLTEVKALVVKVDAMARDLNRLIGKTERGK